MKFLYLLIFISSVWISVSVGNNCTIPTPKVMNCTGLNWTDCPEFNNSITTLILDFNSLTTLETDMCKKWTQLSQLSVRNNFLQTTSSFSNITFLSNLDLSGNQLTTIKIDPKFILTIDVSSNRLSNMAVGNLPQLSVLNISNNQLSVKSIQNLVNLLSSSTKISVFDLSNNGLTDLPIEFMTFTQHQMSCLNVSRNKLSTVDFQKFKKISGPKFSLDLSHNLITNCTIPEKSKIGTIDLSYNLLPKIEVGDLNNIDGLKHIDLSENPLRCLCNETADFINWVKQHSMYLLHSEKTRCKVSLPPANQQILNITCANPTTTVVPPTGTTTTAQPSSSPSTAPTSNSPNTTKESHVDSKVVKITVGILCPIFILGLIGLAAYFLWYRQRSEYTVLHGSQTSIGHKPTCDCLPLLPTISRQNRNINIDPEEDNRHVFTEDRLNIVDTLNILCTSKDTNWLKENITGYLDLNIQIIDTGVTHLPYADFTLIFVNGDACLKNTDLLNNFNLLLQEIDKSEIRVMLQKTPDFSKVTKQNANEFTEFIKRNVRKNGHYFNWDADNKVDCLMALKTWLHLNNVRQNV